MDGSVCRVSGDGRQRSLPYEGCGPSRYIDLSAEAGRREDVASRRDRRHYPESFTHEWNGGRCPDISRVPRKNVS